MGPHPSDAVPCPYPYRAGRFTRRSDQQKKDHVSAKTGPALKMVQLYGRAAVMALMLGTASACANASAECNTGTGTNSVRCGVN